MTAIDQTSAREELKSLSEQVLNLRQAVQSPEQVASDHGEPHWEYRLYNDYVVGLEQTVLRIGEALKVRGPADRQALVDAMQRRLSENAD